MKPEESGRLPVELAGNWPRGLRLGAAEERKEMYHCSALLCAEITLYVNAEDAHLKMKTAVPSYALLDLS